MEVDVFVTGADKPIATQFLKIPWTARRSNQSVLKEINSEYSLEGLMLKLQYFDHLLKRAYSLENTPMRKIEGKRRRGWQRLIFMESITDSVDKNLSNSRRQWRAEEVHVSTRSQSWT